MTKQKINGDIDCSELLLIDSKGEKLGVHSLSEAMEIAKSKGMDLVEVSEEKEGSPAVCKIMNFGQFNFEKKRRLKKNLKKDSVVRRDRTKIMRLTHNIGTHDLESKMKKVVQWLSKNCIVKVTCQLRGASIIKKDEAKLNMDDFVKKCEAKYEAPITLQGRMLSCVIVKDKNSIKSL